MPESLRVPESVERQRLLLHHLEEDLVREEVLRVVEHVCSQVDGAEGQPPDGLLILHVIPAEVHHRRLGRPWPVRRDEPLVLPTIDVRRLHRPREPVTEITAGLLHSEYLSFPVLGQTRPPTPRESPEGPFHPLFHVQAQ